MIEIHRMVILDFRVCVCKVGREIILILSHSGKRISKGGSDKIVLKRQKK